MNGKPIIQPKKLRPNSRTKEPETSTEYSRGDSQMKTIRSIVNCLDALEKAYTNLRLKVIYVEGKCSFFVWTTVISLIIAVIALFTAVSANRKSSSHSALTNSAIKMEIKE